MGSPVSALLANMVMEFVEEQALSTFHARPKWWFRYVDDSHTCLKRSELKNFEQHLNSVNENIQFTHEVESEAGLAFLDTNTVRDQGGNITVTVYRKPTHTEKYLDYKSHHPTAHKRSVVNTLLRRARDIPSTEALKLAETEHVKKVLRDNNYPESFVRRCETRLNNGPANVVGNESQNRTIVLPYISGLSEKLSRMFRQHNIKVAHRTTNNISDIFPRPKGERDPALATGVVYKIDCKECDFCYYGQTDRSLKTRVNEHKRAVCQNNLSSNVAEHTTKTGHEFDFSNAKTLATEHDFHRRLFLEAWFSELDENSGNFRTQIPAIYRTILESCKK